MNLGVLNETSFNARIRFNNRIVKHPKNDKSFYRKTSTCAAGFLKKSISVVSILFIIFAKAKKMISGLPDILTKITNIKRSIKLPS